MTAQSRGALEMGSHRGRTAAVVASAMGLTCLLPVFRQLERELSIADDLFARTMPASPCGTGLAGIARLTV